MPVNKYKADLALLMVALVWGITFVVVKDALADITPHYFNAIRFFLGGLFLASFYQKRLRSINKGALGCGLFIGFFLFSGYALQTVGLQYTSAANAGFITGLSVVMVPILTALLLHRLPSLYAILGVISATLGLALLTLSQGLANINLGDLLVFGGALGFGLHIVMVSKYAPNNDAVHLAIIQIFTVAAASLAFGLALEPMPQGLTKTVWLALLITAIPATALAYLIQNSVQKYTSPTHTAIIFATEPVFAALAAFFLLGEILTSQQVLGCVLILAGMLVAELRGGS